MIITFLPFADVKKSLECLDDKRLCKQRVEAMQILNSLRNKNGWNKHPSCIMWSSHIPYLQMYYNESLNEWVRRKKLNTMAFETITDKIEEPWFVGYEVFHYTMQAALMRKDPVHYKFNVPKEYMDVGYFWPSKYDKFIMKEKVDAEMLKKYCAAIPKPSVKKEKITVKQLKQMAKDKSILNFNKMNKAALMAALNMQVVQKNVNKKPPVKDLRKMAKEKGITGFEKMRKDQLMTLLNL